MSLRSRGALLVVVAFLLVGGVAGAGGGSAAASTDQGSPAGSKAPTAGEGLSLVGPGNTGEQVDTHTPAEEPRPVTMRVSLEADGDARWTVTTTFPVRTDNESAAFDDLASDFENGELSLGYDTFQLAAVEATEATGREMELRSVNRSSSRTGTRGTVTLAFTWSNFARTDGDRLSVGDAFNTSDGTWLPRLNDRQTLVVEPPSGYGVVSAPQVGIFNGAARWEGPYRFDGREPWIVYSGAAATTAPPTTGSPTTTPPPGGFSSALPVAILVLVAGVSAAALVVYMRRDGSPDEGGVATGAGGSGGDDGTAAADAAAGDSRDTSTVSDATGAIEDTDDGAETAGPTAGASASGEAATEDEPDEAIDETLLSDEERVERLLERNGGRMKQANIVKETGWSNAKVSQLLSAMAENDRVDKLRIGRENLISFPEEDVTDIGSDDER